MRAELPVAALVRSATVVCLAGAVGRTKEGCHTRMGAGTVDSDGMADYDWKDHDEAGCFQSRD